MNRTNFVHALFALAIQALVLMVCRLSGIALGEWLGAALAIGFFAGREYAQVEYKVRDRTGLPIADMMPWHVVRPGMWSLDARLDLLFPVVACVLLAIVIGL